MEKQVVTFLKTRISNLKDEKPTEKSKYYVMVRAITYKKDPESGFEFASQEFNAIVLSTPETVENMKDFKKGHELPFGIVPRYKTNVLTGTPMYDTITIDNMDTGESIPTDIVKADVIFRKKVVEQQAEAESAE